MAGSLNKVFLIGNLGHDPEIRNISDNNRVARFTLATNESWKDKATRKYIDKTQWHRIVIFNDRFIDIAERYLKKGSKVFIKGQIQTRKWLDSSSKEHHTTEIVLGRFRGELILLDNPSVHASSDYNEYEEASQNSLNLSSKNPTFDELDDEIPF